MTTKSGMLPQQMCRVRRLRVFLSTFLGLFPLAAEAGSASPIVINEIHYDPEVKTEQVEFIELHNTSSNVVDLSGWSFTAGVAYTFPAGASIGPGGYAVVAEGTNDFRIKYGFIPYGPFAGKLANEGELVELRDAAGQVMDEVDYQLGFPWPTVGGSPEFSRAPGSSIELVHPSLDNDLAGSWRASLVAGAATGETLVAAGSSWRYLKGLNAPSSPVTAWRQAGFNDGSWANGTAPIGYGETFIATPLSDMQGGYTSVFLRKAFVVADSSQVTSLTLEARFDDGFIAWINGVEVRRANMPAGEVSHTGVASGAIENLDFVTYALTSPGSYLVAGTNVLALQAHNSSVSGSSDFFVDLRLIARTGSSEGTGPTPGRRNGAFADNIAPQIRQVDHQPEQPKAGETVTITAKATDPDGVASLLLQYQIVEPGSYIELTDAAYTNNWTSVPMNDTGSSGDETAGDDVYTAQVPASVQLHRRLIRYRIVASDGGGRSVQVPYPDDPQPNFAYFVYSGIPAWSGSIRPGVQPVMTFPAEEMGRLPAYHLIAKRSAVEDCTWFSRYGGDQYRWAGTLVYDGKVYDHIHYRARGGVWRYSMVKNMWKFRLNRGHEFQARDNWGRKYATRWTRLNLGASIQQGDFNHRGEQGMFESVGFRLFNLAGIEAPHTSFVTFRVVDEAAESYPTNQFEGDFWGVYLVTEQIDGRFLDEHGLPDGNLYKMENGFGPAGAAGELKNQGPFQVDNYADVVAFRSQLNSSQPESWWQANFDVGRYYSYYAMVQAIHHYDICCGKNYYYYFNPDTGKMQVHPWDFDLTWADNMYEASDGGTDEIYDRGQVFSKASFNLGLKNRVRELRDLLFNPDQAWRLIDEYAELLQGTRGGPTLLEADRAMWDYNPKMNNSTYTPNPGKAGQGRFYQFPGESATNSALRGSFAALVQIMKHYVTRRSLATSYPSGTPLSVWANDPLIPVTPVVNYVGPTNFPLNRLEFRVSTYGGNNPFAALKWRIAEITPTNAPASNPGEPNKYEIETTWESTELTPFNSDVTIPSSAVRARRTYRVRCRFKDTTGRWSHWSAPVQFVSGEPESAALLLANLRLSEMMFHSPAGNDYEFVELHNTSGTVTLDLNGVKFTQGIEYTFGQGVSLPPDGYLVLAKAADLGAFRAFYNLPASVTVLGPYSGNLANEGELVTLRTSAGGTDIASFEYRDSRGWPLPADGSGHSLVPLESANATQPTGGLNYAGNWRASTYLKGSPGRADPPPPAEPVLNEFAAHTDFASELDSNDWIELYNPANSKFTFGAGWYLSDDGHPANLTKWMIPPGTVIPARGWISFDEQTGFHHPTNIGFGLSKSGEQLFLSYLPGTAEDRVVDSVEFKAQENNWSQGRFPDGGPWWYALTPSTRDTANPPPPLHLVLSELMYHPPDSDGTNDNSLDEFIEVFNPTVNSVPLYDTNGTWRIDGGVNFSFPTNLTLSPFGYLLIVNFSPTNAAQSNAFRAVYGLTSFNLSMVGPYSGKLANNSERVALEKPLGPDLGSSSVSWVVVDELVYGDQPPWEVEADGFGPSLHRQNLLHHAADPANWRAAAPTPGGPYGGGVPPTITQHPLSQVARPGESVTFAVAATGAGTLLYQWRYDAIEIPGATNVAYAIPSVQPSDEGTYTVVVSDVNGSVVSEPATLEVLLPPVVISPSSPLPLSVVQGGDITIGITVNGTLPMSYHWRRGVTTLTNEYPSYSHSSHYTLNDVQPGDTNITVLLTNAANIPGAGLLVTVAWLTVWTDTDGDGMPDEWERTYRFATNNPADAELDADLDTMANLEEYLAGTDPRDSGSFLKVESITADFVTTGAFQLSFRAVAGRSYTILFRDSLLPGPWERLMDFEALPADRTVEVMDVPPANLPQRHYRLVIPQPH